MPPAKVKWQKTRLTVPKTSLPFIAFPPKKLPPFTLPYERECQADMWKLMTNEYMRLFFDEVASFRRVNYRHSDENNRFLVLRRRIASKEKAKFSGELPEITLKRFQNIPARIDSGMKRKPLTPEVIT